jgi:hypothetical protein
MPHRSPVRRRQRRTPCPAAHNRFPASRGSAAPRRDLERLADVLKGFHLIAFAMLMWKQVLPVLGVL